MAQQRLQVMIGDEKRATEYLANERTFLAWIRTSIAIISLGFVVAKFSLWLRELATQLARRCRLPKRGFDADRCDDDGAGRCAGYAGSVALSRCESRH